MQRLLSLFFIILCFGGWGVVKGEFGVPKAKEAGVDADGSVNIETDENPYAEMALHLQSLAPIDIQDAVDISAVLQAAQDDPETQLLLKKLKEEEGEALQALAKEVTPMEIVQALKQSLDELKAIETLFADPQRAVDEMNKEGLVEKSNLKFYKQNPEALAEETRRGVYFGFVSMALAGNFLR